MLTTCKECVDKWLLAISDICKDCGGYKDSVSNQLCRNCSRKNNECQHCRKPLTECDRPGASCPA